MSINIDNKCSDQPTTMSINLEVWSNGDVNFVLPETKSEGPPIIPLTAQSSIAQASNDAGSQLKLRCHCDHKEQHLYVKHFGSWIDLGHVGLSCKC